MAKASSKKPARRTAAVKPASAIKKSAAHATQRAPAKIAAPKLRPGELVTVLDYVRFGLTQLRGSRVVFAHGTTDPVAEAAFLVCETLNLHPDQFEMFATARVTASEGARILALFASRIRSRKPAAYLVNKIYLRGMPFYVDERVIVPRSFIGELLDAHFTGEDGSLIDDPADITSVLDLCTGSGCLAIMAARAFPNAAIDAVDLSPGALDVAARNVSDYGLQDRITLLQGDLFDAVGDTRYDLIISNPPYVDAQGMADLPRECRHEPGMAFDGGVDGLDLVRRIVDESAAHLNAGGGLLCEIGRCRPAFEAAYPDADALWLDTEDSSGEVFWLGAGALK